ncbi:MAG TPA: hypothetical protein VJB89_00290 [Candidatus Nanoarchaeia archaeon]|nr:hypothetical protein [Candidatus Nanoarchaeia archaeon]
MKKIYIIGCVIILVLLILAGVIFYFGMFKTKEYNFNVVKDLIFESYDFVKIKFVGYYRLIFYDEPLIDVNQLLVKVLVKYGSYLENSFIVYNNVDRPLYVVVSSSLSNVNPLNNSFELAEKQEVRVAYNSDYDLGVKVGKIYIVSEGETLELPVIVESESERPNYDVNLDVSPEYFALSGGQTAQIHIKIFNLINKDNSVDIGYNLYGTDGKIYSSEMESLGVGSDTEIMKSFVVPNDIEPGLYVYTVDVKYNESVGVGSYVFNIYDDSLFYRLKEGVKDNLLSVLVFVVLVFILVEVFVSSIIMWRRNRKS